MARKKITRKNLTLKMNSALRHCNTDAVEQG
jgi:hypothetical protein